MIELKTSPIKVKFPTPGESLDQIHNAVLLTVVSESPNATPNIKDVFNVHGESPQTLEQIVVVNGLTSQTPHYFTGFLAAQLQRSKAVLFHSDAIGGFICVFSRHPDITQGSIAVIALNQ